MANRSAVLLLTASLIPASLMAQRHGGQGGTGMTVGAGVPVCSYGSVPPRSLGAVAPAPGFGNINHPGWGYAPNTPGIGFPVAPGMQPLPTTAQPGGALPFNNGYPTSYRGGYGSGHVHGYGCGHYGYGYGYGTPVVVAVPVPVYFGGSYSYSPSNYGAYPMGSSQPVVVVIQEPPAPGAAEASDRPRHWPNPARAERPAEAASESAPIYVTRATANEQKPSTPITLLVLKDHTIYAVSKYWKEGDRLYFVTSYGAQNSVSLDLLDLEFTKRLNEERNVKFEL